ncbi:hypothetical protein RUM44_013813 [Polyplax serrata]|uniref:Peptidase S1 domain-containing protein n=1 Tax=Polyplax serrata TaxID=468196 RepID=A0ABR1BF73_POLSC
MNVILVFLVLIAQSPEIKLETERLVTNATQRSPHKHHLYPAIIDGYPAKMTEFPFAVRLYIYYDRSVIMCTGITISRKLVLTAAHCLPIHASVIVVTGNSDQTDYVKGKNLDNYARYRAKETFVHPEYNSENAAHDIGIVKVSREMVHKTYGAIEPSYDKIISPQKGTIFGWGGTPLNAQNNKLFGKHLMVHNCTYTSTNYGYLCLMDKGICHGDSGGGMIINNSIYGIASFYVYNQNICHTYFYTAISQEANFIKEILRTNSAHDDVSSVLLITASLAVCFLQNG